VVERAAVPLLHSTLGSSADAPFTLHCGCWRRSLTSVVGQRKVTAV
jgi:hypothetical protein